MPRIQGKDIPNDKKLHIALTYIQGLGAAKALEVCERCNLDPQRKTRDLTEDELSRIGQLLDNEYTVEGTLRRQTNQHIARLREIACYRGLRHRRSLPCRGQRTKTNARTKKGVRKTVAGKKGVKDMR